MKTTLLKLVFLPLIITTFYNCEHQKKRPHNKNEIVIPEQIVTTEQAKEMYDSYTNRRAPLIQHYEDSINNYDTKFDVARYGSYDYQTIKQYIAFIEREAKLANVEISTLRFYFSNYPNKKSFNDGKDIIQPRQNSFFIAPTIKKGDKEFGFYTVEHTPESKKVVLLTNDLQEYKEKDRQKVKASFIPNITTLAPVLPFIKAQSLILNEANMSPPPY